MPNRPAVPSFLTRRQQVIAAALNHLHDADQTLSRLIRRVGPFTLKVHRDRFDLLVRSILSQQISMKAAQSIRKKLEAQLHGQPFTPAAIAKLPPTAMRAAGLSAQKTAYLYDLAAHVLDGRLELSRLHRMSDDEVIAELIAVKGIGKWTAQMFLMFALGRLDVFPVDDLGLRSALRELYNLPEKAEKAVYLRIAEPWRPYSTIASWYAWRLFDLKANPEMDASQYPV